MFGSTDQHVKLDVQDVSAALPKAYLYIMGLINVCD